MTTDQKKWRVRDTTGSYGYICWSRGLDPTTDTQKAKMNASDTLKVYKGLVGAFRDGVTRFKIERVDA